MLPSRRELAREYGVSPLTIERAINPLISEGVLRADDRRGTFVAAGGSAASAVVEVVERPQSDRAVVHVVGPRRMETAQATIGIVASLYVSHQDHLELNNFWVRLMVQSLEQAFSENGYRTRFCNRVHGVGESPVPLRDTLLSMAEEGVDAFALVAFGDAPHAVDESLAVIDTMPIPVVCITSGDLRRPVPHVFFDNRSAGYDAAQWLLKHGSDRLLYFAPFTSSWVAERLEGVRAAVEHASHAANVVRVYSEDPGPWIQEEDPQVIGYHAAHAYLEQGEPLSGVICANDGLAFGFLQAASERGLEMGRDFGMVGFDDHPDARDRHLTTLRPPMDGMGKEASRQLLRALRGEPTNLQTRLRWHLIPRSGLDSRRTG